MCAGGVDISGNSPCVLNALLENLSRMYCFSLPIFSGVGRNGILEGRGGGFSLSFADGVLID